MVCRVCHNEISDNIIVCPHCNAFAAKKVTGSVATVIFNRGHMYLEDGEFEEAERCFDAIIAGDPRNAQAYLGKLMAELGARSPSELAAQKAPYSNKESFIKARECADDKLKAELDFYVASCSFDARAKRSEPSDQVKSQVVEKTAEVIACSAPIENPEPAEKKPKEKREKIEKTPKSSARTAIILLAVIVGLLAVLAVSVFVLGRSSVMVLSDNITLGTVSGNGTYWIWDTAVITATPTEGSSFVSWSDGNTDNPRKIDVTTANSYYKAIFSSVPSARITVEADSDKGSVTGGGVYQIGSVAEIEAIPAEGSEFVGWSDGSMTAKRRIQVSADAAYTAYFSSGTRYRLTASAERSAYGTVSGSGVYAENTRVTVTATPNKGYMFVEWSDGNTDAARTVVVNGMLELTAKFVPSNMRVQVGSNYFASITDAMLNVSDGDTLRLLGDVSIDKDFGFVDKNITIDGNGYKLTQTSNAACISYTGRTQNSTLTLRNLILENTWNGTAKNYYNRCIWLGGDGATMNIENCILEVVNENGQAIFVSNQSYSGDALSLSMKVRKTVTITESELVASGTAVAVSDNTDLVIADGSIIEGAVCLNYTVTGDYSTTVVSDSVLTCDGGASVVEFRGSEIDVKIENCDVLVNDTLSDAAVYLGCVYGGSEKSRLSVTGESTNVELNNGATLFGIRAGGQGTLEISGGTYNTANVKNYLIAGKKATQNTNGTWSVQ